MNPTIRKWGKYFDSFGVNPELKEAYLAHVSEMINRGVPPIFSLPHLAALLGRTPEYLASVINSPCNHYRSFKMRKRSGGYRQIDAPYPALLECQRWILDEVLSVAQPSAFSHGFVSGRSILSNATVHLGQRVVLKMDLKDFFPSVERRRVISIFRRLGYPQRVAFYLAQICCVDSHLPQGAATSPALSNIAAKRLDARLSALAASLKLAYSRYADDMALSGEKISPKLVPFITEIIKEEGFTVNQDKTHLCSGAGRRVVTGISVAGKVAKIPRKFKRSVRQEAHYVLSFGKQSHVAKEKIRDPFFIDSLIGRLCFWAYVEPEANFPKMAIAELRRRYK